MADTAVDTTVTAEVTAKVRFIQGFILVWKKKDFVNFCFVLSCCVI